MSVFLKYSHVVLSVLFTLGAYALGFNLVVAALVISVALAVYLQYGGIH